MIPSFASETQVDAQEPPMPSLWASIAISAISIAVFTIGALLLRRWRDRRNVKTFGLAVPLTPSEARYERSKKVLDPTKRKSLQPGNTTLPKGYREARPNEIVHESQIPPKVIEKKIQAPAPVPQVNDTATLAEIKALEGQSFEHKFFGSQLVVGSTVIATGLNRALHSLEITERGQVFIDNHPFPLNPTDVVRVKQELAKTRV